MVTVGELQERIRLGKEMDEDGEKAHGSSSLMGGPTVCHDTLGDPQVFSSVFSRYAAMKSIMIPGKVP